jgi:hypothetical protein
MLISAALAHLIIRHIGASPPQLSVAVEWGYGELSQQNNDTAGGKKSHEATRRFGERRIVGSRRDLKLSDTRNRARKSTA